MPKEYTRAGACKRCGFCCYTTTRMFPDDTETIPVDAFTLDPITDLAKAKRMKRVITEMSPRYLTSMEGSPYDYIGKYGDNLIFAIPCKYLQKDNTCEMYEDRWKECRDWPTNPDSHHSLAGALFECGYSFTLKPQPPKEGQKECPTCKGGMDWIKERKEWLCPVCPRKCAEVRQRRIEQVAKAVEPVKKEGE